MARSDEEFLGWLQGAPSDFRGILAYRCAMRVVPLYRFVQQPSEDRKRFATSGMRALLTQAVALVGQRKLPSQVLTNVLNVGSVREFAEGATFSSRKTFGAGKIFATGPGYALQSAADAVLANTLAAERVFEAISKASDALSVRPSRIPERTTVNARNAFASCIDEDIAMFAEALSGADILRAPISTHQRLDQYFAAWTSERIDLFAHDDVLHFWAKWYARAMAGDPLPWDLQEAVALIPEKVWKAGPNAVAKRIKEIEDEFYGKPLDDQTLQSATEALLADPVVYSDIFLSSAQSVTFNIKLFEERADLNALPDGFTGFEKVAGAFDALGQLLAEANSKDIEIAELKGNIQTLNAVINELRRELRDTRQALVAASHSKEEASRLKKVGQVAKKTLTYGAGLGSIAAGYLAILQLGDRWSEQPQNLRAEAQGLAETMENLDAPPTAPRNK